MSGNEEAIAAIGNFAKSPAIRFNPAIEQRHRQLERRDLRHQDRVEDDEDQEGQREEARDDPGAAAAAAG